jgi:hypothetical protein
MSPSKRPSRKFLGYEAIYLNQRTNFDIGEYVQNPSMIKKLHEEKEIAHAYSSNLEKLLEDKMNVGTELELQVKEITVRLEEASNTIQKLGEENKHLDCSHEKTPGFKSTSPSHAVYYSEEPKRR